MHRALLLLVGVLCGGCPGGGFPWQLSSGQRQTVTAAEVTTLGDYQRQSSRVLVRRVQRPTLANLDLAAYHANIVTRQLEGQELQPGAAVVPPTPFGGVVRRDSIVASIDGTPLTDAERRRPLAFAPLTDYLARQDANLAAGLEQARVAVRGEHWGLPGRPGAFLQQITLLYLHRSAGRTGLWVKIEFEPGARLFKQMPDEDGDGYPEIYGELQPDLAREQLVRRVEQDYVGRVLSTAQVHAWANELASYWYPSYNTDVVKLQGQRRWPLSAVEPDVIRAGGLQVQNPTLVIRGKPQGQALYNVFVVPGVEPLDGARASSAGPAVAGLKAAKVAVELEPLRQSIAAELKQHGASWGAWVAEVAPLHRTIKAGLARRDAGLKALIGHKGFLFYRRSLEYVVGGPIQAQPSGKNPLAAIVEFKDYLRGLGVDFLLVPVPTKAEVFPDRVAGVKLPAGPLPMIHPEGRKFLLELNRAGVEVVDLLPAYLAARGAGEPRSRAKRSAQDVTARGAKTKQELYQPQDTHWTDAGLRQAAELVAQRIRRYAWYAELAKTPVRYTLKPTSFRRQGDLVSRLADGEQRRYRPQRLLAQQVLTPDGKLFEDDAASPIVVLGDSFTGVYQRTDCGSAGVSAHIAQKIQYPVDLVMSYGGGPNVRNTLLSRDEKVLRNMRLVIWLFAARDFFNYWDDWAPLRQAGQGK